MAVVHKFQEFLEDCLFVLSKHGVKIRTAASGSRVALSTDLLRDNGSATVRKLELREELQRIHSRFGLEIKFASLSVRYDRIVEPTSTLNARLFPKEKPPAFKSLPVSNQSILSLPCHLPEWMSHIEGAKS